MVQQVVPAVQGDGSTEPAAAPSGLAEPAAAPSSPSRRARPHWRREVLLLVVLYLLYGAIRNLAPDQVVDAQRNARAILGASAAAPGATGSTALLPVPPTRRPARRGRPAGPCRTPTSKTGRRVCRLRVRCAERRRGRAAQPLDSHSARRRVPSRGASAGTSSAGTSSAATRAASAWATASDRSAGASAAHTGKTRPATANTPGTRAQTASDAGAPPAASSAALMVSADPPSATTMVSATGTPRRRSGNSRWALQIRPVIHVSPPTMAPTTPPRVRFSGLRIAAARRSPTVAGSFSQTAEGASATLDTIGRSHASTAAPSAHPSSTATTRDSSG